MLSKLIALEHRGDKGPGTIYEGVFSTLVVFGSVVNRTLSSKRTFLSLARLHTLRKVSGT